MIPGLVSRCCDSGSGVHWLADRFGADMRLDDAIRQRGFRRWYERQLYESHAYLVTGFLALIMMAIALEVVDFRQSIGGFLALLAVGGVGGALCIHAWRQFTTLLARAEYLAARATCPGCGAYARFIIMRTDDTPDSAAGCTLHVCCKSCTHAWCIG